MLDKHNDFRMECSKCPCKEYEYERHTVPSTVTCQFCTHAPIFHRVVNNHENNTENQDKPTNIFSSDNLVPSVAQSTHHSPSDDINQTETREIPFPTAADTIEINEESERNANEEKVVTTISVPAQSAIIKRLQIFLRDLYLKEDGRQYTIENENRSYVMCAA